MAKYAKYAFVALLISGLFAISYGGCGGGSGGSSDGGTVNPTQTPNPTSAPTPGPTDDDFIVPTPGPTTSPGPTASPGPSASPTNPPEECEGDAFIESTSVSTRVESGCLTDYIVQIAQTSTLTCFCSASEAGDFIFTVLPIFPDFMKVNLEFPGNNDPENPFPNSLLYDWKTVDCNSLELFTTELFMIDEPISIGTLDDMIDTAPDQLTFTANISEVLLSTLLGSSGQTVSCDYCSIEVLPDCAPDL